MLTNPNLISTSIMYVKNNVTFKQVVGRSVFTPLIVLVSTITVSTNLVGYDPTTSALSR